MRAQRIARHPEPHSKANRAKLAAMIMRLFGHWELEQSEQLALLGLSEGSRMTLQRYRKGNALNSNRDLLDRVSHLLGIHKSLRILYPHNRDLAYRWPKSPNKRLGNLTPVEYVRREGFGGLASIRHMLDVERGR